MSDFFERHAGALADFSRMSCAVGVRADYVQGGGGNTSVKLDGGLMAIKASGFHLCDVQPRSGYAVVDGAALKAFYEGSEPGDFQDAEKAGAERARAMTMEVPGLAPLRPSVEAGFHSLLDTYVLHTHAVYANLATCSAEGRAVAAAALAGLTAGHVFVPYINPGAQLTFAVLQAIEEKKKETGAAPSLLFMKNHGFIVTGDDADECLALHDQVNERLAAAYGVSAADWPAIAVKAVSGTGPAPGQEGQTEQFWQSDTPWLHAQLTEQAWNLDDLTKEALFPDQLVYLGGKVAVSERGSLAEALQKEAAGNNDRPGTCTLFRQTGEVLYRCGRNEAQTIEETLCAVLFVSGTIRKAGRTVVTMSEAGRQFISNWESEHYRSQITAR